ncbi:ANTAR domain-containing protein [Mycolicibacterium setense]|uniref:ANTAR domain-containing protein n=1 Tax=Mycolicibacterium setense TaxID=431269 RepID=UPI0003A95B5C|nr:ANTAR domain-containing protein [Mycolicibacterium setense]MCV7110104.1 ANTAR domain-containing protein [Mycolicibacterium setense]
MYIDGGWPDDRRAGARALDTAKGIVVALRRCNTHEAFADIVEKAHRHRVGPICLAEALVAIAQNAPTCHLDGDAVTAARAMWMELRRAEADTAENTYREPVLDSATT